MRTHAAAHVTQQMRSAADVLREAERLLAQREESHLTPQRVRELVTGAGLALVEAGRHEEALQLLACVPAGDAAVDGDLFRLRAWLALYELRRTARMRRRLMFALVLVLLYLVAIAPTVFISLENPTRLAMGLQPLDWSEGLYWSIITSTTTGYGDIVPFTPYARLFALFDALLGVLLLGVVAGLILNLTAPRQMK